MSLKRRGEVLRKINREDALILNVLQKWREKFGDDDPIVGRTKLQKVFYFLKAVGAKVNYNYDIYIYGPYSADLTKRINYLVMNSQIKERACGRGYNYDLGEVDDLLMENGDDEHIEKTLNLLGEKTPDELELYSTVHFVKYSGGKNRDYEKTIKEVEILKGNKFDATEIKDAIKFVEENFSPKR